MDRFICGLCSQDIRMLLAKTYIFERAVKIGTVEEPMAKDIKVVITC